MFETILFKSLIVVGSSWVAGLDFCVNILKLITSTVWMKRKVANLRATVLRKFHLDSSLVGSKVTSLRMQELRQLQFFVYFTKNGTTSLW